MSEGIRKAWLLEYLITFAEQHGGQLSSLRPKKGKVQIINFRTLPESPEEWVWADVSDKLHFVTVRFTMEAVKFFNSDPRNAGRRLTSRRWGIATIRCSRPFLCQPPTENGKGLENESTITLIVDHIDVTGSEGEAMFGDPKCVTNEEPVRRWLEGLRHGSGGNVLQLERIQRDMREKEARTLPDMKSPAQSIDILFKADVSSNSTGKKTSTDRQRYKEWIKRVRELGLVSAYECHQVSEDQLRSLEAVCAFGLSLPSARKSPVQQHEYLDSPPHITTPTKSLFSSPDPQQRHIDLPHTPSHWSASQKTNLEQNLEGDGGEMMLSKSPHSLLKQEVPINQDARGRESVSEGRRTTQIAKTDDSGRPQIHREIEGVSAFEEIPASSRSSPNKESQITHSKPPHSPFPPQNFNPTILVPDSDISGSHSQSKSNSQSLSMTQPSISQHYNASHPQPQGMILHNAIPESPYPKTLSISPKLLTTEAHDAQTRMQGADIVYANEDQLDTDDEAAQLILAGDTKTSPPLRAADTASHEPEATHPAIVVLHDGIKQGSGSTRTLSEKLAKHSLTTAPGSQGGEVNRGRKRGLAESSSISSVIRYEKCEEVESPAKRPKGRLRDEVVIEEVEHNPIPWKQPSFARSGSEALLKQGPTQMQDVHAELLPKANLSSTSARNQPQVDVARPEGQPMHDPSSRDIPRALNADNARLLSHEQTRLKLGGWQPQRDLPNGQGFMTWENFNTMLLTVGRVREQANKSRTTRT